MLIAEVRDRLKQYNEEDLTLLISEIYKSIPKKMREEKDIDEMIRDIHAYKSRGKMDRKQDKKSTAAELKPKIDQFIDFAYKQYYFAPNSYVHKKERPKWRFHVKAFIKDLESIPVEGEDGKIATDLLKRLYEMLSYGCAYYIFNTENPFDSVGISQIDLLDRVLQRLLASGINDEDMMMALKLVIYNYTDRDTLTSSILVIFANNLKTTDVKEFVIKQSKKLKAELIEKQTTLSKKNWNYSHVEYEIKERRNNLTILVFLIYMSLCEHEKAIRHFHADYLEKNKEISLYILLKHLEWEGCINNWLEEYEKAVKKGISPRDYLQKEYHYILKNKKFSS